MRAVRTTASGQEYASRRLQLAVSIAPEADHPARCMNDDFAIMGQIYDGLAQTVGLVHAWHVNEPRADASKRDTASVAVNFAVDQEP